MTVHIYSAPLQPATRFWDRCLPGHPILITYPPHRLLRCGKCGKRRWAAHCVAQVFYDEVRFWCKQGKGCKA